METRKSYWYSIIKYVADFTKGEPLNIGIFLEEEYSGKSKYILLENDNAKLKAIFETKIQSDTYRFGKDYFVYLLDKISNNEYPTDNAADSLLKYLLSGPDLPKGFLLSEPQFAKTSNPEILFNTLAVNYIGKRFLDNPNHSRSVIIKDKANFLFQEADILHKKIKSNVRLTASPNLPFKYQIDYAYNINNKIDLIHSAPENIELLPDWFEKVNVFSTKFEKSDKISLLFDSSVETNLLSDTNSVINTLINSDPRIEAIDINSKSNGLTTLINKIKADANDVKELNKLIAI
ncbi:hypothetical protein ACQUEF_01920 [Vagococcus fluvialis]|uniref:hypothetical protein n=1 Tax=Vagococcus fluvialis TaxID=2738 RepID=UPI003D10A06F